MIVNTTQSPNASRPGGLALLNNTLLCTLACLLILIAPLLGLMVAAIGAWHAIVAGSIFYLPLGLAVVLAALAIVQSHKKGYIRISQTADVMKALFRHTV